MHTMRAKLQVSQVEQFKNAEGVVMSERVMMRAVAAKSYPLDGADDDNTYAKWSPSADFTISIANPALFGVHTVGDKFYVDFTKAE